MLMKKAFLFTAAMLAVFVLAGCADSNEDPQLPILSGLSIVFEVGGVPVSNASVGNTARVVVSRFTAPDSPITSGLHYRWMRSGTQVGPYAPIEESANSSEYQFTDADLNNFIMVVISHDDFLCSRSVTPRLRPILQLSAFPVLKELPTGDLHYLK